MADIALTKNDLPFLFSGSGTLTVHVNVPNPDSPLPLDVQNLASVDFGVKADPAFNFGPANAVKLGISGGVTSKILVLSSKSTLQELQLAADHGLADYFHQHPDNILIALALDASAAGQATATFTYAPLTVSSTVGAGVSSSFVCMRPYSVQDKAGVVLKDFFGHLRLPSHVAGDLALGEVVAFSYGGYLKFGASLAIGYQLKGAPAIPISQLNLSEHYQFSVAASVGLQAQIAGEFHVEARAATNDQGIATPGWVRLIIRKKKSTSLQIAADAGITGSTDLQGLPGSSDEFLGALLGVRAKNWLNVVKRVQELSDWTALTHELDDLAKQFIGEWMGKAFDELSQTDLPALLGKVEAVVKSYDGLENTAITLFDRYFDRLDALAEPLKKILAMTSWDSLNDAIGAKVDGEIWQIVQTLTDGDPLAWILGQTGLKDAQGRPIADSLKALQKRAQDTLDLILKGAKDQAHGEIRKVIGLAKTEFGLDKLMAAASALDSVPKLKAAADAKAVAFVERLLDVGINDLRDNKTVEAIRKRLHDTLGAMQSFEKRAYAKFQDAMKQSFEFHLHAEYNRATEADALFDLDINVTTPDGLALLKEAGAGNFQNVLAGYRPDLVRLRQGTLSHKLSKSSALAVNVLGWHSGWHYFGIDRLIIDTEQQIVAEANGGLTAYTTVDMTKERERQRQNETAKTNLVLRFLGESHGALKAGPSDKVDRANQQYLIDSITSGAMVYNLTFTDTKTPRARLDYFLSFAQVFGLAEKGATVQALLPLLPKADPKKDDFGNIEIAYEVRYTDEGLRRLFGAPLNTELVRQTLRQIVWAHYKRDASTEPMAWAYASPAVYNLWKDEQVKFSLSQGNRVFEGLGATPIPGQVVPQSVTLTHDQAGRIDAQFQVQDQLVKGLMALDGTVHAHGIAPGAFERTLSDLAGALKTLDSMDGAVNGLFAVFDRLVLEQTPASQARLSSLKLTSSVGSQRVTKVILSA